MKIRDFSEKDIPEIVQILKLNGQYSCPEIDGADAMMRVSENESAIFRVVEINDRVVAMIRGVYDGSRALIHQISVHPDWQGQKIGKILVKHIARLFWEMGATTVSVTASSGKLDSRAFFRKLGFEELPVTLMVHFDIDSLLRS